MVSFLLWKRSSHDWSKYLSIGIHTVCWYVFCHINCTFKKYASHLMVFLALLLRVQEVNRSRPTLNSLTRYAYMRQIAIHVSITEFRLQNLALDWLLLTQLPGKDNGFKNHYLKELSPATSDESRESLPFSVCTTYILYFYTASLVDQFQTQSFCV